MRLLILGGTSEASALARALAGRTDIDAVLSFAGRTQNPAAPPIPFRVGGFGGVEGLRTYMADKRIVAVVDATHPFAARMSAHAAMACEASGIPLAIFSRPGWTEQPGDRWTKVATMEQVAQALGPTPRRVFLTIGSLQLAAFAAAPQHHYVIRAIDPPEAAFNVPKHRLILARGPFGVDDEIALMRDQRIDTMVTKNSGGDATGAKIAAARQLGIAVVMVERPSPQDVPAFEKVQDVLSWVEAHRPTP